MMRALAGIIAFTIGCGSPAFAEPCVGPAFDVPLPGAQNVSTRHADVPSPQFPGLWQQGNIEGYFYALFANGEAVLKATQRSLEWDVKVSCEAGQETCVITANGAVPTDANRVADILGRCLLGKPRKDSPKLEVVVEPTPELACGLAQVEDGPDGMLLQRLLIVAGADPGPVDGLVGGGTRKALAGVLGNASREMDIPAAVAALDQFLCTPTD
jgi:hypothetical protein